MSIPDCFSPSRHKGYQERAENLCDWCPVIDKCFPEYRNFRDNALDGQFVIADTLRTVVRNPATNMQVAVISMSPGKVTVSVPVEGMAGWTVNCRTLEEATRIARRELSATGKAKNRILTFASALVTGRLS